MAKKSKKFVFCTFEMSILDVACIFLAWPRLEDVLTKVLYLLVGGLDIEF